MEETTSNPFKKAGLVLLIIGVIDIGVMVYCITNGMSYSSSFNIFAVIAGALLLRGGVKTARVIRWFSIFMAFSFIGVFLITPLTTPLGLIATKLKINTFNTVATVAFGAFFIALLFWLYQQLSSTAALKKIGDAGYKTGKPKTAVIASFVLVAILGVTFFTMLNGESAEKAKLLAQNKLGQEYSYHISSISISGESGHALVIAYTDSEIKGVQVQW